MDDIDEKKPEKKKYVSKREWIEKERAKPVTAQAVQKYAMFLIERRDYTEKALKRKVDGQFARDKQFNQTIIDMIVDKGYINDERYMERMVENLMEQSIGIAKIKEKLYMKGFSQPHIEIGIIKASKKDFFPDVLAAKQKKYGEAPITDIKLKQKALGFLVRKGFDFASSNKAISMDTSNIDE